MKDWEKRFDKKFIGDLSNNNGGGKYNLCKLFNVGELKDFISSELEKERDEAIEDTSDFFG